MHAYSLFFTQKLGAKNKALFSPFGIYMLFNVTGGGGNASEEFPEGTVQA